MASIGDLVPKAGIYTNPGVVVEKKEDGTVVIDTEPMTLHKYHRYTNTTGLSEKEKNTFNQILDSIYQNEDDVEKINGIQKNIDRLKVDPSNSKIVQYLRNQQSHLIRKAKDLPRTYNWDASAIRALPKDKV
ncbi:hypothetical protein [Pseudobacteriovorax antillogorgiicola]|uniref:Uncharacterized protein n=1 Tax=Pseudobacteriovorax antillogorgiicola TaxID=1513793 RepID=A0A1Y6BPC7_9BACT|nr:hypothetical protein [Pseudobacteriovorax antillogorgiicola]TCS53841.1 hypothetical protein EDD56_107150 [Pseudobacteriovorax antillogorgiicola]SMF21665.1 hypothetical protein SAMN06296036_107122 [Pseudobacteriovorax antillogorgiicola]